MWKWRARLAIAPDCYGRPQHNAQLEPLFGPFGFEPAKSLAQSGEIETEILAADVSHTMDLVLTS